MSREYEFSAEQNRVIVSLSRTSAAAGSLSLAFTAAVVFATIRVTLDNPALMVVGLIIASTVTALTTIYGVWLIRASLRFKAIVATQGNDMSHLMDGFRELTRIYETQWWLSLISIALGFALVFLKFVPPAIAIAIAVGLFQLVGMGKTFAKAGRSGWAVIIPIYNALVLVEIAAKPAWWLLFMLVPGLHVLPYVALARRFGCSAGFGVGLALLPVVFFPILGFGRADYYGSTVN